MLLCPNCDERLADCCVKIGYNDQVIMSNIQSAKQVAIDQRLGMEWQMKESEGEECILNLKVQLLFQFGPVIVETTATTTIFLCLFKVKYLSEEGKKGKWKVESKLGSWTSDEHTLGTQCELRRKRRIEQKERESRRRRRR